MCPISLWDNLSFWKYHSHHHHHHDCCHHHHHPYLLCCSIRPHRCRQHGGGIGGGGHPLNTQCAMQCNWIQCITEYTTHCISALSMQFSRLDWSIFLANNSVGTYLKEWKALYCIQLLSIYCVALQYFSLMRCIAQSWWEWDVWIGAKHTAPNKGSN